MKKLKIEDPQPTHKIMLSVPDDLLRKLDALPQISTGRYTRQRVILAMVEAWLEDDKKAG